MTRYLLDVSVLMALMDPAHTFHHTAHAWFEAEGAQAWATCPLTQNGVLRILGNPRYPNSPGGPDVVSGLLSQMTQLAGHAFWANTISLLDPTYIDSRRLIGSSQVTDSYLLALAVANAGKFATFDKRLLTGAVRGGAGALHLIA